MRKFLISAALISATALTAPVAAQNWGGNSYGYNQRVGQDIPRQVQQIRQQINAMYQRRLLSNNEMRSLQQRADKINQRFYKQTRNGLSQREHRDLQNQIQDLRQRIQRERFEGRDQRRDDRRGGNRW